MAFKTKTTVDTRWRADPRDAGGMEVSVAGTFEGDPVKEGTPGLPR